MDRVACVDLPALPLQILLRSHPQWKRGPAAVVDKDKPLGIILSVNERARAQRVLPGMRYSAGLALCRDLRAGVVVEADLEKTLQGLVKSLQRFSPFVEKAAHEPGVFWLDASGFEHLHHSLEDWALSIQEGLARIGFHAVIAVGFSRFGSYAATRVSDEVVVFSCAATEREEIKQVPIERLVLEPRRRDMLFRLGIHDLGAFMDLPSTGIRKRFGAEVHALHKLAKGDGWNHLEPEDNLAPAQRTSFFDLPESDLSRLLTVIEESLSSVLSQLSRRHEALAELHLLMTLERGEAQREILKPAAPTLEAAEIFHLVRLRLESLRLESGVVELRLGAIGFQATQRQLELFEDKPRRDLDAAHRAFAKIRAEMGNQSILYATLHEGHLPEARFGWESCDKIRPPRPEHPKLPALIRRIYTPPVELPARSRYEPDGWVVARPVDGPVEESLGPYILSGGWWAKETTRAYYYVRTRSGRWLWIYNDRKRRRWFLHGEVE